MTKSIWDNNDELVAALHNCLAEGRSAAVTARVLSERFNIVLTRNMVIGRMQRDRKRAGGEPKQPRRKPKLTLVGVALDEPKPLGPVGKHSDGCQWIHGDPATPSWRMCGRPCEGTYCSHHEPRTRARARAA